MKRKQTKKEEFFNSLSHGIGAFLSLTGLVGMLSLSLNKHDSYRILSSVIYGTSLILLYLFSTLYHAATKEKSKKILRIFDHASIYVLIAGTYTPFCLISMHGLLGWTILTILWGLTFIGIFLKIFFTGKYNFVSTAIYLAMGWIAITFFKQFMDTISLSGFLWVVAGGLAYTFGTVFYALETVRFCHVIWHFFVMLGSLCHFLAIFFYVI
ncbi:hemolysin III family protein [Candidatus Babeliales bacterium]|nr:hemolysin III family protein [Candidatus Babeliales bacterium]MCF7899353.1 hemolysin III family protein [Candidatus Babeliales bacterium]